MEWSMDDALELIEQYRVHPELWNRTFPKYKDKLCRFRAWSDIAEKFGCSKAEVERKMNVLLTQYRREKHKLLVKLYDGITPSPSKWYAFKRFEFLEGTCDGTLSLSAGRRKSRDLKYFNAMGMGLPLFIANSQSINGWGNADQFSSSTVNPKESRASIPIGFQNNQNSELLNTQNLFSSKTNHRTSLDAINIDEKFEEQPAKSTSSPNSASGTGASGPETITIDVDIKQEIPEFIHRTPLGRPDSPRSYNSSTDGNRLDNDDFAQDLRVSATSRGFNFGNFDLASNLLQQPDNSDGKLSPPRAPIFSRRSHHTTSNVHSHAQQSATSTTVNLNEQDDCDFVGSNVSIKLRSMERTQRIIAEKLISEVLFYGQIAELEKTAKISPK